MRSLPHPALRLLALAWAMLQLATPGLSAIAHGKVTTEESRPTAHIEATSSEKCPVVHTPECGVCRYLSQDAQPQPSVSLALSGAPAGAPAAAARHGFARALGALPQGRAPPVS